MVEALKNQKGCTHIIVVNNDGGQIFSSLFKNSAFINRQIFSLQDLAKGFGLEYSCYTEPSHIRLNGHSGFKIIELRPNASQSKAFTQELQKL